MNLDKANNSFVVFSGIIEKLQLFDDTKNFIANNKLNSIGKISSVGLAATEMAGAAITALQSSIDSGNQIQYFHCYIDAKEVSGCFSVVFFTDGDEVDVVAELQADGSYFAYAVRRPIDHRLWLYPYCFRGRSAHRKSNKKMSLGIGSFFFICLSIISVIEVNSRLIGLFIIISFLVSLSISIFVYLYYGKGWLQSVLIAENIFLTLGYDNPQSVDMDVEYELYLKDIEKNGSFYYVNDSLENKQNHIAPWVYRYRSAPEVPESSKLKE